MPQDLVITIVQTKLVWESPEKNIVALEAKLANTSFTNLIVLPEMFNTGFSMHSSRLCEKMDGLCHNWLKKMAKKHRCTIGGSLIIEEDGKYYNRFLLVNEDGDTTSYDKRHLFRMANEHDSFTGGSSKVVCNIKGWRVVPYVCYDLRFPVWCRNDNNADLYLFIANWPEVRRDPWKNLLEARAHENQVYVIGVNRVGKDENNIAYSGDSLVFDPKGNQLSKIAPYTENIEHITVSYTELEEYREKFPAYLDADKFKINR